MIRVKFTSEDSNINILPSLMVPTELKRLGLNQVVNHLLGQSEPSKLINYDFLIDGRFLRTRIDEYLAKTNKSTENLLEIQVIETCSAPKPTQSINENDWISSISHVKSPVEPNTSYFITASYDGSAYLYSRKNENLISGTEENEPKVKKETQIKLNSPVKSVCFNIDKNGLFNVWTGTQNHMLKLFNFGIDENDVLEKELINYTGHEGSIDSLALDPSGNQVNESYYS